MTPTLSDVRVVTPHKPWFQFRLRTLLLFMSVATIPMAWLGSLNQRLAEREQAMIVRSQMGGGNIHADIGFLSIEYDLDFSGNAAVTDSTLEPLQRLGHLRDLNLAKTSVSDAGVEYLRQLSSLRRLDLSETKFSEAGCKQLEELLPDVQIHR